jgi:hypothetical protein
MVGEPIVGIGIVQIRSRGQDSRAGIGRASVVPAIDQQRPRAEPDQVVGARYAHHPSSDHDRIVGRHRLIQTPNA